MMHKALALRPTGGIAVKTRWLSRGAVVAMVLAGLTIVPVNTQAQTNGWIYETVGGPVGFVERAVASMDGETLGVAYKISSTGIVGFTVRTGPETWVSKSVDVTGNLTPLDPHRLLNLGVNTWGLVATNAAGATARLWFLRSTNNGETWTVTFHSGFTTTAVGTVAADGSIHSGIIELTMTTNGGLPSTAGVYQVYSINNGASFVLPSCNRNPGPCIAGDVATAQHISDNTGDPLNGQSSTNIIGATALNKNFAAIFLTNSIYVLNTANGAIWTLPYLSEGSSTLSPALSGLTTITTAAPVAGAGVGNKFIFISTVVTTPTFYVVTASKPASKTDEGSCEAGHAASSGNSHTVASNNSQGQYIVAYKCSAENGFYIYLYSPVTEEWGETFNDVTGLATAYPVGSAMTNSFSYVLFLDGGTTSGILKLVYAENPVVSSAATVTHTLEETGLTFDVDPLNKVVTVKTFEAGVMRVRSYDPSTLNNRGASPVSNNCDSTLRDGLLALTVRGNGPQAGKQFIGFTDCIEENDCDGVFCTDTLSIRAGDLNNPDQTGSDCGDFCDFDLISAESCGITGLNNELPGGTQDIGNIVSVPISYSASGNGVTVGFAYNDAGNGNIGVWYRHLKNNLPDSSCAFELPFTTSGGTSEICSWRNPHDGNDYMAAAAGGNAATQIWRIVKFFSGNGDTHLSLSPVGTYSSPYDKANGISCAGNDTVIMDTSARIMRVHATAQGIGSPAWGTVANPHYLIGVIPPINARRGVAFSTDQQIVAFYNGTTIGLANATSGILFGSVQSPQGDYLEMRLDDAGNVLWVLTDTTISRYDLLTIPGIAQNIHGRTGFRGTGANQKCVDENLNEISCTVGPTVSPSGINDFTGFFALLFGGLISGAALSLIVGLIIICLCILFFLWLAKKVNSPHGHWFILCGVGIGWAIAVPVAGFPTWPIVGVVAIAAAMVLNKFRPGAA